MKKFIAISDLHGTLPEIKEEADILLIAGDIMPLQIQRGMEESEIWFKDSFLPWADSLPIKYVVLVGGNHDFWLEREPDKVKELCVGKKVEYLVNEYIVYAFRGGDVYAILGTPLCKPFGRWAFMKNYDEQRKILKEFMGDTKEKLIEENGLPHISTILLTHDAPYGCSDVLLDTSCSWYTPEHLGNQVLRELVEGMKPDVHIHGHLHSTNHEVEKIGETCVYNVSLLGEDYKEQYQPLVFSL